LIEDNAHNRELEAAMTPQVRKLILRANAVFLLTAAAGGLRSDTFGIFFARGHVAPIVAGAPHAGISFVEAHGLALIIGVLLWRVAPLRSWHVTGGQPNAAGQIVIPINDTQHVTVRRIKAATG
jgi:hypothetical protein